MKRRNWLKSTTAFGAGITILSGFPGCAGNMNDPKTILLVSGWQDVNIGDIAHTPGLLNVLQTFLPETNVILWKKSYSEKVEQLLNRNFPNVKIIHGYADKEGTVESEEVLDAMKEADIMIHGSGPSVVGIDNLLAWIKYTTKPLGIFGVTIQNVWDGLLPVLEKASFVFTRETKSLEVLAEAGIEGDHVQFGPDATFYFHLRNEEKATTFLEENGLEDNKFICAIPRLRYTPYYKIKPNNAGWSDEKIARVDAHNAEYKEKDHAKLREVMIAWVRDTGNKVLVCPEMTYQVDIMDELLIDPLPEDVKPYIVKRGYWLPDEAASVYRKANSVFSFECHSPIIAAQAGIPIFYLRQPEDTIKGQMYYDLGLSDWVFEIDETEADLIIDEARKVWSNYADAIKKLNGAMQMVTTIYTKHTEYVKQVLVP